MGRGYSASRSQSGRPTLRIKRSRSMSLHALKKNMDDHAAAKATVNEEAPVEAPRRTLKVARQRPAPSAAPKKEKETPSKDVMAKEEEKETKMTAKSKDGRGRSATKSVAGTLRTPSAQFRKNLADLEQRFEDVMEASEDEDETIMNTNTMTKYKECGRVVDAVLDILTAASVAGANTKDLCDQGDAEVQSRLKSLFTKTKDASGKRLTRGLSYPTNISVNEVLCNDSPFRSEEGTVLKGGDVVKLHLGCHLDGYPVSAARTIVVGAAATTPTDTQENEEGDGTKPTLTSSEGSARTPSSVGSAVEAARVSLLTMLHALRPGTLNADVTDLVAQVGHHYGVQAVEGVLSNRTKRWVPDSVDCIIGRRVTLEDPHQDVGECEIGEHQVWCLDAAFTNNGNYRITLSEKPITLFRRTADEFAADARVSQANETLQEITDTHFCFPFHFKSLEEPLRAKMGIHVLQRKGMVDRLPPLRTKNGFVTARFCATVAVTPKRVTVLCGAPSVTPVEMPATMRPRATEATLEESVLAVLRRPLEHADGRSVVTKRGGSGAATDPAAKRMRVEPTANEE